MASAFRAYAAGRGLDPSGTDFTGSTEGAGLRLPPTAAERELLRRRRQAEEQAKQAFEELQAIRGGCLVSRVNKPQGYNEGDPLGEDGFPGDEPLNIVTPEDRRRLADECEVVHKKIAIRKSPGAEGKILGVAERGDRLRVYDLDEEREWGQIHFTLKGGHGSTVFAWVMVRHPTLGQLIRAVDAGGRLGLPAAEDVRPGQAAAGESLAAAGPAPQAAAGPDAVPLTVPQLEQVINFLPASEKADDLVEGPKKDLGPWGTAYAPRQEMDASLDKGSLMFQVVYKRVAIRAQPSARAAVIGGLQENMFVDTFGWDPKREWRKLYCTGGGAFDERRLENWARGGPTRPVVAWVLTKHEDIGTLLEPAAG